MAQSCPQEMQSKLSRSKQGRFVEPIRTLLGIFGAVALAATPALSPAYAQVESIDPNQAIDADLETPDYDGNFEPAETPQTAPDLPMGDVIDADINAQAAAEAGEVAQDAAGETVSNVDEATTYKDDDLIGAAEGVFGKGAKGLAGVIEDILKKQGRPNAYITGREASGAFVVGLRYGSGKLHHKIEGERDAYWTGPSIGFDVGGNAAKTFVLVYNLYDTEEPISTLSRW